MFTIVPIQSKYKAMFGKNGEKKKGRIANVKERKKNTFLLFLAYLGAPFLVEWSKWSKWPILKIVNSIGHFHSK